MAVVGAVDSTAVVVAVDSMAVVVATAVADTGNSSGVDRKRSGCRISSLQPLFVAK
jgi:hypothetical protein